MCKRNLRRCSCSSSVVYLFVGFCLGLGEVLFGFHSRSLMSSYLQTSEGLDETQYGSYDVLYDRRPQFDRLRNNTGFSETSKIKHVRLLCWVMTREENLATKAQMIKDTWGKRCDVTLYFSSKTNLEFPTIGLDVPDGRRHLYVMTSRAFRYIHNHHFDDADWFLKADDDTYVIVENLRHFLQDKNTSSPIYYGQVFHRYVKTGYNSGGAGYVLGREALKRFAVDGPKQWYCTRRRGSEDVALGRCMKQLNVSVGVTKDTAGKERFNWHNGFSVLAGRIPSWVTRYLENNTAAHTASDHAISFHYVNSGWMKVMDFLIYNLTIGGVQ